MAAKKKVLGCPVCGYRVSGREKACPKCGTPYSKQMLFECPFCSGNVPRNATICPHCSVDLTKIASEGEKKMNGRPSEKAPEKVPEEAKPRKTAETPKSPICKVCDQELKGDEEICPSCGIRLREPTPARRPPPPPAQAPPSRQILSADESATCPACGKVVTLTNSHCPFCGAEFEEEIVEETIEVEEPEKPPQLAAAPPREEDLASCPVCGTTVSLRATSCPKCLAEFEPPEEAEAPPPSPGAVPEALCPVCGKEVSWDDVRCPHCQSEFEEEAPPEVEVVTPVEEVVPPLLKPAPWYVTLRMNMGKVFILILLVAGAALAVLAISAQMDLSDITPTTDPVLQDRASVLEGQRNLLLITSASAFFLGMFGFALPMEPVAPRMVPKGQMVSVAREGGDVCSAFSLTGNASFIPARNGLNSEKMVIASSKRAMTVPKKMTDNTTILRADDGSTRALVVEPIGLDLLDSIEEEFDVAVKGAGFEGAEAALQVVKHGFDIVKDFHFKPAKSNGSMVLRIEYSGLLDACRTVREERPSTCRQFPCVGCSCLLTAAARATDSVITVDRVDNRQDQVVFTLKVNPW